MWKKKSTLTHVCHWLRSLFFFGVPLLIDLTLIESQIAWGTQVFPVGLRMSWSDTHSLENCLNSRTTEWTPLSTPDIISEDLREIIHTKNPNKNFGKARHLPAGGKCYVCMQPSVYSSFCLEFTKGFVSV